MKCVAAINDLSGLGRCSLAAAIPVLSVMGIQTCPVPTAVLTNQTCYPTFSMEDLTGMLPAYLQDWKGKAPVFDGICSGFLSNAGQVDFILRFLDTFATTNTLVLIDPVMGDDGRPYPSTTTELCRKMKQLIAHADIITPNLTEACLLTGVGYNTITSENLRQKAEALASKCLTLGPETVVLTGVRFQERLHNIVASSSGIQVIDVPIVGGNYSGTGDLLAAVVMGAMVQGKTPADAVSIAARFLSKGIADAEKQGLDPNGGICFEPHLKMLLEEISWDY